jgi:hypothetical protein
MTDVDAVASLTLLCSLMQSSTPEELRVKMEGLVRKLARMVCDAVAIIDRAKEAAPGLGTAPESE